jgi:hypothetical protein
MRFFLYLFSFSIRLYVLFPAKLIWNDEFLLFFIANVVGLSPLHCGHFWPIVRAPDDRWGWLWSNWWNEDWQGKPKYSEKTCPSATLSITNPTLQDPGSNPGRRGGKPATNRLSYCAANYGSYRKSIRLLGWMINLPQSRYLHSTKQTQKKRG